MQRETPALATGIYGLLLALDSRTGHNNVDTEHSDY